jgi:hypothetical protein
VIVFAECDYGVGAFDLPIDLHEDLAEFAQPFCKPLAVGRDSRTTKALMIRPSGLRQLAARK